MLYLSKELGHLCVQISSKPAEQILFLGCKKEPFHKVSQINLGDHNLRQTERCRPVRVSCNSGWLYVNI